MNIKVKSYLKHINIKLSSKKKKKKHKKWRWRKWNIKQAHVKDGPIPIRMKKGANQVRLNSIQVEEMTP